MIEIVTMYRVVCDHEGCDASPQDGGDYYAMADPGQALDQADWSDWVIRDELHLCGEHGHRAICMGDDQECPRRDDLTEAADGWMYCPDHLSQGG